MHQTIRFKVACIYQATQMARIPRIVVSGYPHHVTQRGNRRQKTFFHGGYQYYIGLMFEFMH